MSGCTWNNKNKKKKVFCQWKIKKKELIFLLNGQVLRKI